MPQPVIDLGRAIAHAADACLWARDVLGFTADPWQQELLRSTAPQLILNCGRQVGKSTVIASLAVHTAIFHDDSLVLLIAPTQRQSIELARKCLDVLQRIEPIEKLEEDAKTSVTLSRNGSRIVALPGHDAKNIRGYSAPRLIVFDEAGFASDAVYDALLPMLAASPEGRIALLSTPYLNLGFYYEIWHGTGSWERYEVRSSECPRISAKWLEERKAENPLTFAREYECQFGGGEESLFGNLDNLVSFDFEPFIDEKSLSF
jgi:hypothetical protein